MQVQDHLKIWILFCLGSRLWHQQGLQSATRRIQNRQGANHALQTRESSKQDMHIATKMHRSTPLCDAMKLKTMLYSYTIWIISIDDQHWWNTLRTREVSAWSVNYTNLCQGKSWLADSASTASMTINSCGTVSWIWANRICAPCRGSRSRHIVKDACLQDDFSLFT